MKKKLKPAAKTTSAPRVAGKSVSAKATLAKLAEKADKTTVAHSSNGKTNGKQNGIAYEMVNPDINYSNELDSRELLSVLTEVKQGNFSVRLPDDKIGISGKICDTINHIISLNEMLME